MSMIIPDIQIFDNKGSLLSEKTDFINNKEMFEKYPCTYKKASDYCITPFNSTKTIFVCFLSFFICVTLNVSLKNFNCLSSQIFGLYKLSRLDMIPRLIRCTTLFVLDFLLLMLSVRLKLPLF
jgi:hypothetical protein